jgi:hypothetical protein
VKCSKSVSNRVSDIIRRYIDHMNFAAFSFIIFFHVLLVFFIIVYTSCRFLFNFVSCVFLSVCCEETHPKRGDPICAEHTGSEGVNFEK